MFQTFNSQVIGFPSVAQQKRGQTHSEAQTEEKKTDDEETQVKILSVCATQTDQDIPSGSPTNNENNLAKFLKSVERLIDQELDIEEGLENDEDVTEEAYDCRQLYTFLPPPATVAKKVSCISWNSRGGTIAVGWSVVRHDAWCNHESLVAVYILTDKAATPRLLHTAACVTAIDFHPTNPSYLVIGLFSGEVLNWDLSHEEEWLAAESSVEHNGRVGTVKWTNQINQFLSAGSDGCILLREVRGTDRTISTTRRFFIARARLQSGSEGLAISDMEVLRADEYVVGVAGGEILHCSFTSLQHDSIREGYQDPVTYNYQPHNSLLTAIKSDPRIDTFAISCADGAVRVYKIFEYEPRWIFINSNCVLDLFWAGSPEVMGMCGWDNTVKFVNVSKGAETGKRIETEVLEETLVRSQVSTNRKRVVALGSDTGKIQVWSLY